VSPAKGGEPRPRVQQEGDIAFLRALIPVSTIPHHDCGAVHVPNELLEELFRDSERSAALEAALRDLRDAAGAVMALLEKHGPSIVPHLMDTDDNAGEWLRSLLRDTGPDSTEVKP